LNGTQWRSKGHALRCPAWLKEVPAELTRNGIIADVDCLTELVNILVIVQKKNNSLPIFLSPDHWIEPCFAKDMPIPPHPMFKRNSVENRFSLLFISRVHFGMFV